MIEAFIAAWIGTVAAQASPGPNLMAVASVGLSQGRAPALAVVAGVASGVLVWAVAVAAGLAAVIEAFPASLVLLKLVGGAYLLWFGIKGLRAAWAGRAVSIRADGRPLSLSAAWARGVLVVLTNPKAALMWAAVASFLFGAGLGPWEVLAFGPVGALTAIAIYGTYALVFSSRAAVAGYSRAARWIELGFGAAFGALGARLLWDGVREVRG